METGGDILPQQNLPRIADSSLTQIEKPATDELSCLGDLEPTPTLADTFRNNTNPCTDASMPQNSSNVPQRFLTCGRCRSKHQACRGESGQSCNACMQTQIRCSLLNRPFRCEHCNQDFTTAAYLKRHTNKSHKSTERGRNPKRNHRDSKPSKIRFTVQQPPPLPEYAEPQRKEAPNCVPSSSQAPLVQEQSPVQHQHLATPGGVRTQSPPDVIILGTKPNQHPKSISRPKKRGLSFKEPVNGVGSQVPGQGSQVAEERLPKRYQNLNFEIFYNYEKRKMSEDHIQGVLDGIRDEIDRYAKFVRGIDKSASNEVREPLKFLDEVTPLTHLREINEEDEELFSQKPRLLAALRSMFCVEPNTRLDEELEKFGPEVRLTKLPQLICGVLGYLILQLFTKKDPIRGAELTFTELSHGIDEAANTVQHSRLLAQDTTSFQNKLDNRAIKLASSFYDILRPLTHWQQESPHNGSTEQHMEMLRKIIFDSLRLAAELEARTGTFSFFWPRPGDQFNAQLHIDKGEADDSDDECANDNDAWRNQAIASTLMFGVTRWMANDTVPLVYAKATVVKMQQGIKDGY